MSNSVARGVFSIRRDVFSKYSSKDVFHVIQNQFLCLRNCDYYYYYYFQDLVFSTLVVAGLLFSGIAALSIKKSVSNDSPIVIGENSTETLMQKRSKSD